MANSYYNAGTFPSTGSPATSATMRAELSLISGGFDKLPTLTAVANQLVVVNSGSTALTTTSALPAVTVLDTNLTFQDNADPSKQFVFEASGITTATTRTFTMPDASTTLVGTDATQTLTNKTLTAPVLNSFTGSGGTLTNLTLSGSATLTAGTANGVAYLNGSKVLTTGSALTFDGTTFRTLSGAVASGGSANGKFRLDRSDGATNLGYIDWVSASDGLRFYNNNGGYFSWEQNSAGELMRLTSTGLGIGTSSPGTKLHVSSAEVDLRLTATNASGKSWDLISGGGGAISAGWFSLYNSSTGNAVITVGPNTSETMRLDASGNVGIGTSSPAAKLQVGGSTAASQARVYGGSAGSTYPEVQLYGASSDHNWTIRAQHSLGLSIGKGTFGAYGTELLYLDSSGNLGLGVTPSAWYVSNKAIQLGSYAALESGTAGGGGYGLLGNAYEYANDAYKYINSYYATMYRTYAGQHQWFTAASGTAGTAITFTQAMTLTAAGNLGIGTTSPNYPLVVSNAGAAGIEFAPTGGVASGGFIQSYNRSTSAYFAHTNYASSWYWNNGSTSLMTLDASGRLGIGATSPGYPIDVTKTGTQIGATAGYLVGNFRDGTSNKGVSLGYDSGSQTGIVLAQTNSAASNLAFWTWDTANWAERARIDSSGNLLVGTTAQLGAVTARVAVVATGNGRAISVGNGTVGEYITNTSGTGNWQPFSFNVNGTTFTQVGSITITGGNTTNYNTSSDQRLKTNIEDAGSASNVIDAIKIRQFDWIEGGRHQDFGVIAQELALVVPDAISVPEDSEQMMGVDYSKLVPVMVKAIQELTARLEALEAK